MSRRLTWSALCLNCALLLFVVPGLTAISPTAARQSVVKTLSPANHIGGNAFGIAVAGDYAYLGRGTRLEVLDVQDPTQPVRVWRSNIRDGLVAQIQVVGQSLIVKNGNTLTLFDLTNPAQPVEQGSYSPPGVLYDFHVAAGYVYVAEGRLWNGATYDHGGVRVVDLSDPSNPTEVANYDAGETVSDIVVAGNYAYATKAYGGGSGVIILDVSTPTAVAEVTVYDAGEQFTAVATDGSNLYLVSAFNRTLNVQSLANPTVPASLGWESFGRDLYRVTVAGDLVYVGSSAGVYLVDSTDPTQPTEIGSYDDHFALGQDTSAIGDHLFVAYSQHGLRIADISTPSSPVEMGAFDAYSGILETDVRDDFLYAYDSGDGLRIIEMTSPTNLSERSLTPGAYASLTLHGDYALHRSSSNFQTTDISNPSLPIPGGTLPLPGTPHDIAVAGDYAYIADRNFGLVIADIANPAAPVKAGSIDLDRDPYAVVVTDSHAFVGTSFLNTIDVIDVTDSANPTLVATLPMTASINTLALTGHYLLAGGDYSGIHIIDISTPTAPLPVHFVPLAFDLRAFALSGNDLYAAADAGGLFVIDLSDPSNAAITAHFSPARMAADVSIEGDLVTLTDWFGGLYIFDLSPTQSHSLFAPLVIRP